MKKYKGGVVKNVYVLSEKDQQKILDEYNVDLLEWTKLLTFPESKKK